MKLFNLIPITILILSASCSLTPIEMEKLENSKAYYLHSNGDIIWRKNIYSKNILTSKYSTEELFSDSKVSKKLVEKANDLQRKSHLWLASGIYLSIITYAITEKVFPKDQGLSLWVLLGIGIFPSIHLKLKASDAAREAVDVYNNKHEVTFYPTIFINQNENQIPGLGLVSTF